MKSVNPSAGLPAASPLSDGKRRLALKVDCDTYEGTKNGIPNLLRLFDELGIRASFFFTLGPDTSGRAIARVFTQKGFLKKMFRSNAAALYGPRTMLYGMTQKILYVDCGMISFQKISLYATRSRGIRVYLPKRISAQQKH